MQKTAADIQPHLSPDFEQRLISAALSSPARATAICAAVDPKWITDPILADVLTVTGQHVRNYKRVPTKFVLRNECGDDAVASPAVIAALKAAKSENNHAYVMDKAMEFSRVQAMKEAVLASADDLTRGDTMKPFERVQKALRIGANHKDIGVKMSDLANRDGVYRRDIEHVIPTGIQHLDAVVGGGLPRGGLVALMAGTKIGKSHGLVCIGHNAFMAGYKVVHYSLEMIARQAVKRYDLRTAPFASHLVRESPKHFLQGVAMMHKLFRDKRGELWLKSAPTRSFSASDMNAHLDLLRDTQGFVPDLIIVDYGDIMRPERRMGEKRDEIAANFEDLRQIAGERNAAMITATQTNKASLMKRTPDKGDIAESFEKVQIVDGLIAMCMTPEERAEQQMRLYLAAWRGEQDGVTIQCRYDWSCSLIESISAQAETVASTRETGRKWVDGSATKKLPKSENVKPKAHPGAVPAARTKSK